MRYIITADVNLDLGFVTLPAHQATVVRDSAMRAVLRQLRSEGLPLRVSGMGHYTRHYGGQALPARRRLLVWRGCGHGDQLMATAVIRGLLAVRPELAGRIDLAGDPTVTRVLWDGVTVGLPFRAVAEPMPLADWLEYGAHLVLADMCEADSEPRQGHTVDRMLWAAGVEPEAVPAEAKVPVVPITWSDRYAAAGLTKGLRDGRPLVLWQLASSTPIRSYPPEATRRALAGLVQAGCRVLACGTPGQTALHLPLPEGVVAVSGVPLRVLFALVEQADCLVAPDSVLSHAAGGLRRPCVGLWGSFSPAWRAAYYPEHRALCGTARCAPCGVHECGRQEPGCPLRIDRPIDDRYCQAIAGIEPERIVGAVMEAVAVADTRKAG